MQNLFLYGSGGGPSGMVGHGLGGVGSNADGMMGMGDAQSLQGYQNSLLSTLLSQQQAAAAHAAAAMAEQRLSGFNPQSYGAHGLEFVDARLGGMGNGYVGANAYGGGNSDYLEASHRLLLQRLQQGNQNNNWMNMNLGGGNFQAPQSAPSSADIYAENGILGPWSSTSAGLLGKIGPTDDKKKTIRKKHKDKPKRPLSAYNIFFKEERARILHAIPSKKEDGTDDDKDDAEPEETDKKGRKRKKTPHGKIGFENLAKIIGQRWQELAPEKAEYYKKLAAKDMKRYKEQMEVFLVKTESEKKNTERPQTKQEVGDETSERAAKKARTDEAELSHGASPESDEDDNDD